MKLKRMMTRLLRSHSLADSTSTVASARQPENFGVSASDGDANQAGAEERLWQAKHALRQAELRAGVRGRDERVESGSVPVPAALAKLDVALRPGSTVAVRGSTSLLLTLLGAASDKSWIAVVGVSNLGFAAADEYGLDLSRVVVIPRPHGQSANVLAAVIDGFDFVVVGENVRLSPAQRRSLVGRARERRSTLFVAGWPEALIRLEGSVSGWAGIGHGQGYLRERHLQVKRDGRGVGKEAWVRLGPGWLGEPPSQETSCTQQGELSGLSVSAGEARHAG